MTRNEEKQWLRRFQETKEKRIALGERSIKAEQQLFMNELKLKRARTEKSRARLEGAVRHCREQIRRMDAQWQVYENIRIEVTEALNGLRDERIREMMRERYLKGESWKNIALKYHYSPSSVYLKHQMALDELRRKDVKAA